MMDTNSSSSSGIAATEIAGYGFIAKHAYEIPF